jgi:hypothetical protein
MKFGIILRQCVFLALFLVIFLGRVCDAVAAVGCQGTDFWLALPGVGSSIPGISSYELLISSDVSTTGTVQVVSPATSIPFSVVPGITTSIVLPDTIVVSTPNVVTKQGVHVSSNDDIGVVVHHRTTLVQDAYLGLPTNALGNDYVVTTYGAGSEITVVGITNGTTVWIGALPAVTLNAGDVYMISGADFTGRRVRSSAPVAVIGGAVQATILLGYNYQNDLLEQYWPVRDWGMEFITPHLTSRSHTLYRIVTSTPNTNIYIDGVYKATINPGGRYEFQNPYFTPMHVKTSSPCYLMQFAYSSQDETVTTGVLSLFGDPTMITIPSIDNYTTRYVLPMFGSMDERHLNLTIPNGYTVQLDGVTIPPSFYSPVGTTGYSCCSWPVDNTQHTVTCEMPFGVTAYAWDQTDAWGYPGGGLFGLDPSRPTRTPIPTPTLSECASTPKLDLKIKRIECTGQSLLNKFQIINNGPTPINIADLEIRFWDNNDQSTGIYLSNSSGAFTSADGLQIPVQIWDGNSGVTTNCEQNGRRADFQYRLYLGIPRGSPSVPLPPGGVISGMEWGFDYGSETDFSDDYSGMPAYQNGICSDSLAYGNDMYYVYITKVFLSRSGSHLERWIL